MTHVDGLGIAICESRQCTKVPRKLYAALSGIAATMWPATDSFLTEATIQCCNIIRNSLVVELQAWHKLLCRSLPLLPLRASGSTNYKAEENALECFVLKLDPRLREQGAGQHNGLASPHRDRNILQSIPRSTQRFGLRLIRLTTQ